MSTKPSASAPKKSATARGKATTKRTAAAKPPAPAKKRAPASTRAGVKLKPSVRAAAAKEARIQARNDRNAARDLRNAQAREEAQAARKAAREEAARLKEAKAQAKIKARQEKEAAAAAEKARRAAERKVARAAAKAAAKGKPRAPKPGLPVLKKGMELAESTMQANWDERPLTGRDLDVLCRQFLLTPSEFASSLGLQNRFAFTKLLKRAEVVPYDVEMLARLYIKSPSPAPWQRPSAEQAFQEMYGSLVESFSADPRERAYARTLFYTRFTAAMDRSGSTAYRWVETKGDSRLVVSLFLRKLMSMKHPRETLEELARLVHRNRLGIFDERAPYPVHGARSSRRGRVPKIDRGSGTDRDAKLPLDIKPFVL